MASIMCRATTMGANMEGRMLEVFQPRNGLSPPRGWVVHGPDYTVCVMANVFCMLDNASGSINNTINFMAQALAKASSDLI